MLEAHTTEGTNLWAYTVYTTEALVYVVAVPGLHLRHAWNLEVDIMRKFCEAINLMLRVVRHIFLSALHPVCYSRNLRHSFHQHS